MAKSISFPTIEITMWDASGNAKETVLIRPAPFNKIGEITTLQHKLIEAYELKKGCLGELLIDPNIYGHMEKIAELVRVIGKEAPGFDLENLYDAGDIVQLGQIFFSESITADMGSPGWEEVELEAGKMKLYNFPPHRLHPTPSGIARIHDISFFKTLVRIREELAEKKQEMKTEQILKETKTQPEKLKAVATQ